MSLFILIQCQSCFGFARHLKNIPERLFTTETKVALCGLSQHFLFLGTPWEAAGCTVTKQTNNNNKKHSTKKRKKTAKNPEPVFQEQILFP